MRKYLFVVMWLLGLFAAVLLFSENSWAATPPVEGAIQIKGKISATQGNRLDPREATLVVEGKKTYVLILDERGRSLVRVMHGQNAEIWGIPSEKDGVSWLKVLDYTDPRVTAGHELWRHMRCSACVVTPAALNSATPKDLVGSVPVHGRYWSGKEWFTAWAHDEKYLWLASDNQVLQIDLATKKTVRSYGRAEGLPDHLVYQLASDGKIVWIVHQDGVAVLPINGEKIFNLEALSSRFARVFVDGDTVWIISATGTFRFKSGENPSSRPASVPAPALPTADQIAKTVEDGVWIPHWSRRTAHFIADPVSAGGKLFVSSYGDLYVFDGAGWKTAATGIWSLSAGVGRAWFLDSKGLNAYDPATGKITPHEPPERCRGEYQHLLLTDNVAWVAIHPRTSGRESATTGGGLCRFDLATGKWTDWQMINGHDASRISCLSFHNGKLWVLGADGRYETKSAHPGMTYVEYKSFVAAGFQLHCFDGKDWASFPLASKVLDNRLICGQDGCYDADDILPHAVTDICVGEKRIFGAVRLVPGKYFGGYWPSIVEIASRPDDGAPWAAAFRHSPDELNLQGEQPMVLNISYGQNIRDLQDRSSGVLEAVGHDNVLGLFLHGCTPWAITEGCAGWNDEASGKWRKVAETDFRYYWRATAALPDGDGLYIGSDRGLISRFNLATGAFEFQVALADREITRIARNKASQIVAMSRPAQIGLLPSGLLEKIQPLKCESVKFNGKTWEAATAEDLPPDEPKPGWHFKVMEKHFDRDKSQGNFLFGVSDKKPLFYIEDVFFPQVLCEGDGGKCLWLSTYTGILRIPLNKSSASGN